MNEANQEFHRLDPESRRALSALTVFPHEIAKEFAVAVLDGDHQLFQRLVDRGALIEIGDAGRVRIKESLSRPADEARAATPRLEAAAYQAHCRTICAWLAAREPHVHGPQRHAILSAMEQELDSVVMAWNWATRHRMVTQLRQALELVGIFHLEKEHIAEARSLFRDGTAALQNADTDEGRVLLAALQIWVGRLDLADEQPERCQTQTRIGLALLDSLDASPAVNRLRGEALLQIGHTILDVDVEQARTLYRRALDLFESLDDRWNTANARAALAGAARIAGDPYTATQHDEAALAIRMELNVRSAMAASKFDLAVDALAAGKLLLSRQLVTEAIADFHAGRNRSGESRCRAHLAVIDAYEHKYRDAAETFDEVLPVLAAARKTSEYARWTAEAAWVQLAQGHWERSMELAQEVLSIGRASGRRTLVARAHVTLGALALVGNDLTQARRSLEEAISVSRPIDADQAAARAGALLAWLDLAAGEAEPAATRIVDICTRLPDNPDRTTLGLLLPVVALAVAATGDPLAGVEISAAAMVLPYVDGSVFVERLVGHALDGYTKAASPDGKTAAEHRGRRRTPDDALALASDRLTAYTARTENPRSQSSAAQAPSVPAETVTAVNGRPSFSIRFFNGFEVLLNGKQTIEIESTKGQALLAYLLAESPQGHSRDALATLLWPNTDSAGARRNLRQTIFNLRQTAGGLLDSSGFLIISRHRVAVNHDLLAAVDLYHFRERIAASATHAHTELESCVVCIERLTDAVSVYTGDFLAGFSVPDSEPFENWRLFMQEELFETAVRSLRAICNFHTQRRQSASALHHLHHLLRLEPWNEEAHRQVMRVYARDGRRNAALQQYETCRTILDDELNIGPSAETTKLFEQIRDGLIHSTSGKSTNPYKGLNAFSREDAPNFFGRTSAVEGLLAILARSPMVLLIGPSGSGKTSMVEAGLTLDFHQIPAPSAPVANSPDRPRPPSVSTIAVSVRMRPGTAPIRALVESLTTRLEGTHGKGLSTLAAGKVLSDIEHDRIDIWSLLSQVCRLTGAQHLLLHVDQFEEVFATGKKSDIRRLVQFLAKPPTVHDGPLIRIVVSLRADFLSNLLDYPEMASLLQDHSFFLPVMTSQELRDTVVRPAERAGVHFEPGLVERLLHDAGNSNARLPLLQFALLRLWDQREQESLTHAAYDRINGVGGALTDYAEQVYASLTPEERLLAPRLLLRMVHSGKAHDMRRPTTRAELGGKLWPLANKLADMRLVTTGLDYAGVESVELVHDALLDGWARLRTWIDEDRVFQRWHQQMRQAANVWIEQVEDEDTLLRGSLLVEAEQLLQKRGDELDEAVRTFIEAGIELRTRSERSRQQERQRAQATMLALKAQSALVENRTETALVFAAHAARLAPDIQESARILAEAAYGPGTRRRLAAHTGPVRTIVPPTSESGMISVSMGGLIAFWPPDLTTAPRLLQTELTGIRAVRWLPRRGQFAVATDSPDLHILDGESGAVVTTLSGHGGAITAVAATPDELQLVSASTDQTLCVWSVETPHPILRLPGHRGAVRTVAVSPDGQLALSGGDDGAVRLWNLAAGREEQSPGMSPSTAHTGPVVGVVVAPDGRTALSSSRDQSIVWWDLTTRERLSRYTGLGIDPSCIRFSRDGAAAVIGTSDNMLVVLDLRRGEIQHRLAGHAGAITALALPAAGDQLLTGAEDGDIRLWDLAHGAERRRVFVSPVKEATQALAVDRHGKRIATISHDRRLRLHVYADGSLQWEASASVLPAAGIHFSADGQSVIAATVKQTQEGTEYGIDQWAVVSGNQRRLAGSKPQSLNGLATGKDDRHIVTVEEEGVVRRWDTRTGLDQILYDAAPQSATAVAVSPDGQSILVGLGQGHAARADYSLRLLDLTTGVELQRLQGHTGAVQGITFRRDGRHAASCGRDGLLMVWDMASGEFVMQDYDVGAGAHTVAFSPDGHFLLTGGRSATICLWEIGTGAVIRRYTVPAGRVTALAFAPDGHTFLAAYEDGTVREFRLDKSTQALLEWTADNRYVRPLTPAEQRRYFYAPAP